MLTAQQMADIRRFAGYPMLGDTVADDSRDFAYGWVSPGVWQTMQHRLTNMRPEEESILITTYLTPLYSLETAVVGAGDNLDTDQAAVWTRNKTEVSDRTKLFDGWRRRMCQFIGVPPGPYLGNGGGTIIRG
jgi:hypothetical protein